MERDSELVAVPAQVGGRTSPIRTVTASGIARLARLAAPWAEELGCDPGDRFSPGTRSLGRPPGHHLFRDPKAPALGLYGCADGAHEANLVGCEDLGQRGVQDVAVLLSDVEVLVQKLCVPIE